MTSEARGYPFHAKGEREVPRCRRARSQR